MKDPFYRSEKKRYTKPIPSREWIIQTLDKHNAPISFKHIKKLLNIKHDEASQALVKRLNAMVRDGQLLRNRNDDYVLVQQMGMCRGYIHFGKDRQPYLFDEETQKKYSISGYQLTELLENDYVLARHLNQQQVVVVEITSRTLEEIVGRVQVQQGITTIQPFRMCCYADPVVMPNENPIPAGCLVRAKIIGYPKPGKPVIVEVIEQLPEEQGLKQRILTVCGAFGIPEDYRGEYQFSREIDLKGREDWRSMPFVTIDGNDARDFDDALYVETTHTGYIAYIAIADVSHYVEADTDLDLEAKERSTSVYFPSMVMPMLPKSLSNDLCSLVPNQDRYVLGVKILLDHSGHVTQYGIHEAIIHSHARLTYEEVQGYIEQATSIPDRLASSLKPMIILAEKLAVLKQSRGALQFNRQEKSAIIEKERIVGFSAKSSTDSMRLVEVYMLLANELVAEFCIKHKLPSLYRNHGRPEADKLSQVLQLLKHSGFKIPSNKKPISSKQLSQLIHNVTTKANSNIYDLMLLRALPQAIYSPECKGHFGLAYQHYLHFTSPIRRYPDLLVHRQLKRHLQGKSTDVKHLNQVASHCSYTERRAEQASRLIDGVLKCEFMQDHIGKRFSGKISAVMNFGVFVTIDDFGIDGMIHISKLPKDYYDFDEKGMCLIGRKGIYRFALGDSIQIVVDRVDVEQQYVDFIFVDSSEK